MTTSNPVILVTGASRGIGRSIAIHAAAAGYSIAVNYSSNSDAANETVQLCEEKRVNDNQLFKIVQANIGLAEERQKLVQNTLEEFGRIDALVNNAGIAPRVRNDITETTLSSFNEVLKINLEGPYFITQRVVSYWLNDKPEPLLPAGFKVIFVGSISAESVSTNRGEYCISKAGLDMVVKLWGVRLGVEGIQVVELRPGIMATDMTSKVKEKYDKLMEEGLVPQKRWGTADDMGLAAKAILTGQFPFTTGDVIHVDGGLHIHKF